MSLDIQRISLNLLNNVDAEAFGGEIVGITSASDGSISPINPPINFYRNQVVTFDLGDPSLSFVIQTSRFPLFDFYYILVSTSETSMN